MTMFQIDLKPSKTHLIVYLLLNVLALTFCWFLSFWIWLLLAIASLIYLTLFLRRHGWLKNQKWVQMISYSENTGWSVKQNNVWVNVNLYAQQFVSPFLIVLYCKTSFMANPQKIPILIFRDILSESDFRLLSATLRLGVKK